MSLQLSSRFASCEALGKALPLPCSIEPLPNPPRVITRARRQEGGCPFSIGESDTENAELVMAKALRFRELAVGNVQYLREQLPSDLLD